MTRNDGQPRIGQMMNALRFNTKQRIAFANSYPPFVGESILRKMMKAGDRNRRGDKNKSGMGQLLRKPLQKFRVTTKTSIIEKPPLPV